MTVVNFHRQAAASLKATPDPTRAALLRHDGRAPRYTSYPTALQFSDQVDEATYRGWLSGLPVDEAVSLYVHVPLCARLCWYCGCNTRAVRRAQPVSEYVDYLALEIGLMRAALPARLPVSDIHFGGGTPNMLAPEDMATIFEALGELFEIDGAPLAMEIDPAVLTEAWVKAAAKHGLSRASLGVQDLSPKVQAAVNRHEPFEVIARGVGWLRDAGVRSINLDLMYGLPRQGVEEVLDTLDAVLTLRPERLALFGYAHVPWMKPHQKLINARELPDANARLDQAEAAAQRLFDAGYERIGLDHFALPTDALAMAADEGRLHRNFQGYTTVAAPTVIGLGASAISRLPQGYAQNHAQELAWRAALNGERLPTARGVAMTEDDRFRGEIIERLMCDFEVDLAAVCARHGRTLADIEASIMALEPFRRDGLCSLGEGRLKLTPHARPVVRSIAAAFDAYFAAQVDRHARAL